MNINNSQQFQELFQAIQPLLEQSQKRMQEMNYNKISLSNTETKAVASNQAPNSNLGFQEKISPTSIQPLGNEIPKEIPKDNLIFKENPPNERSISKETQENKTKTDGQGFLAQEQTSKKISQNQIPDKNSTDLSNSMSSSSPVDNSIRRTLSSEGKNKKNVETSIAQTSSTKSNLFPISESENKKLVETSIAQTSFTKSNVNPISEAENKKLVETTAFQNSSTKSDLNPISYPPKGQDQPKVNLSSSSPENESISSQKPAPSSQENNQISSKETATAPPHQQNLQIPNQNTAPSSKENQSNLSQNTNPSPSGNQFTRLFEQIKANSSKSTFLNNVSSSQGLLSSIITQNANTSIFANQNDPSLTTANLPPQQLTNMQTTILPLNVSHQNPSSSTTFTNSSAMLPNFISSHTQLFNTFPGVQNSQFALDNQAQYSQPINAFIQNSRQNSVVPQPPVLYDQNPQIIGNLSFFLSSNASK